MQLTDRSFSALGEEAFIEPVDTDSTALFWLGEKSMASGSLEAGLRLESVDYEPVGTSMMPARSFDSSSASLGYIHNASEQTTLSVLFDYSERAPSIEELYSDGPHLATQTFDVGDPNLHKESASSLSATANWAIDSVSLEATVYYNRFDDFIYQSATGEEDDGLPVFVYEQDDATFYGIDFSARADLGQLAGGDLSASVLLDQVHAEVKGSGNGNLPRIPANRIGLGLAWSNNDWSIDADYMHHEAQRDVANYELPTDGFDDLSIGIERRLIVGDTTLQFFVRGKNLTDDEQRYHASFVKDIAPAPGRRVEAGVRASF